MQISNLTCKQAMKPFFFSPQFFNLCLALATKDTSTRYLDYNTTKIKIWWLVVYVKVLNFELNLTNRKYNVNEIMISK